MMQPRTLKEPNLKKTVGQVLGEFNKWFWSDRSRQQPRVSFQTTKLLFGAPVEITIAPGGIDLEGTIWIEPIGPITDFENGALHTDFMAAHWTDKRKQNDAAKELAKLLCQAAATPPYQRLAERIELNKTMPDATTSRPSHAQRL